MKWTLFFTSLYLIIILSFSWGYKKKKQFNHPSSNLYKIYGLDVSHHQGKIKWNLVQSKEFKFVYIKATEGESFKDKRFLENYKAAKSKGLKVGGYHFWSLCKTPESQLLNILETIPKSKNDLVPAIDIETSQGCGELSGFKPINEQIKKINTFISTHYGSLPVIYSTIEFSAAHPEVLEGENFYWLRSLVGPPRFKNWSLWQYYNRGRVKGFSGGVDLNVLKSEKSLDQLLQN